MRRYFYFSRDDKQGSRTAGPSPYLQKHMRSRLDGVLLSVFTRCVREWLWTSSTKKKKKKNMAEVKHLTFGGEMEPLKLPWVEEELLFWTMCQ